MRMVAAETLERITRDIFAGWKTPREDATWIATLLVRANLRGHDSHGVIRIPHYVRAIKAGEVNPNPSITIESETPTIAQIDGDKGFGQVVGRRGSAARHQPARGRDPGTERLRGDVARLRDQRRRRWQAEGEVQPRREGRARHHARRPRPALDRSSRVLHGPAGLTDHRGPAQGLRPGARRRDPRRH